MIVLRDHREKPDDGFEHEPKEAGDGLSLGVVDALESASQATSHHYGSLERRQREMSSLFVVVLLFIIYPSLYALTHLNIHL